MPPITVTRTDKDGKAQDEQLEFEFKKDNKDDVKASLRSRKKAQGRWGDWSNATEFDTVSFYVEVHSPRADDKTNKPFIMFNGTQYYIDHNDQVKLVKELKAFNLSKKT